MIGILFVDKVRASVIIPPWLEHAWTGAASLIDRFHWPISRRDKPYALWENLTRSVFLATPVFE